VGPVAGVPGEVEPEFLLEVGETEWNRDQPSSAFGLNRPDATLDHGEAAVLTDSPEPLPDAAAMTPTSEVLGDELSALV
jgi:hypothetical protein